MHIEMSFRGRPLALPMLCMYLFCGLICALSVAGFIAYSGQGQIYILFTFLSNTLLYFGFRKNAIFFDTFIGVFFWLGFWLKLTIRVIFMGGLFHESIGNFDSSGAEFDRALLVTSCGFLGLLVFSFIREKLVFTYPVKSNEITQQGLFKFYRNHRKAVLFGFALLFIAVAVTNIYFGIYQRGAIPQTILPFNLGGIYKWLLLFGLASFSALILKFEFAINKKAPYLVVILSLLEGFTSNVSLLSRGMILNTSALIYGVMENLKLNAIKIGFHFLVLSLLIFVILFGSSVFFVNYLRSNPAVEIQKEVATKGFNPKAYQDVILDGIKANEGSTGAKPLFLDRWVGIEGVMAVSSYSGLGWDLWGEAWKETYSEKMNSFYDTKLILTPYSNEYMKDKLKNHYVSLPGIVAFCFYPGSYLFLFGSIFLVAAIAAAIEISVFKLGGQNVILCSLLAQVVAFRFASFGYVPGQSYLLFGSIYLNLFIIYFADKFLVYWDNRIVKT